MFPYGVVIGVLYSLSKQRERTRVSNEVDRMIDSLLLDDADLRIAGELKRRAEDARIRILLNARRALVLALRGQVTEGTAAVEELEPEQFPAVERRELFSTAIFVWILAGRPDAARDVLEVERPIVRTRFVFASRKRERFELALAAIDAAEGRLEDVRPLLARATRPGNASLHRFLAYLIMAQGEHAVGRVDVARDHVAEAAAVDLMGEATHLLDRWRERLQPAS